jgi:hypothetical protein
LLFLPGGIGRLPNRLVSGRSGFVKIQFFVLYHRIPHIDRSSARAFYLRFFVSVRMASGTVTQDTDKKAFH